MIEMVVVILILGIFVFPVHISAGCMGLYTTWFIFRCYETFKNQPLKGKRVLSLIQLAFFINFITSLILGALLAFLVYAFIFEFFYLFLFNLVFCFLISIRWFDFSYRLFQRLVIGPFEKGFNENKFFVICKGLKNNSSFELSPVFTDAGFITLGDNYINFDGTFIKKNFSSKKFFKIEKKSFEIIKIYTHAKFTKEPDIILISLKDQFYPFRSRENRDIIFQHLLSNL